MSQETSSKRAHMRIAALLRMRLLSRMRVATLLVLVTAVGGPMGWYIHSVRSQRLAVEALRDAGATVLYDWEWNSEIFPSHNNGRELSERERFLLEHFDPDTVSSASYVSLGGVKGGAGDEHIALIGRLKSLRALRMGKFSVTEAGTAPLAGLKQLRAFVADDTFGESDPGPILSRFGEDPRLEKLVLIDTTLDDEDIAAISRLSRLEMLRISRGTRKIDDADLAKLAGLERLKDLRLPSTRITADGLKSLARMGSLESISFEESSIDDLAPFLQFPGLRELDLGRCPVDDRALSAAGRMRGLKRLSILSTSLTDAGLAHLRGARALEELTLESDSITPAGIKSLSGIESLERIGLLNCKVPHPEWLEFMEAHPGMSLSFAPDSP